jgi:hypothetical protein
MRSIAKTISLAIVLATLALLAPGRAEAIIVNWTFGLVAVVFDAGQAVQVNVAHVGNPIGNPQYLLLPTVPVTLIPLYGTSFVAHSQEHVEGRRQEKWRLSWNVVDRGLVSWGEHGKFTSRDDCLAAEKKAVRRKVDELPSRGSDVTEHGAVIVETRRNDQTVLTVVHFFCAEEKDWVILVAQQPRRSTVAEDQIGPFSTEEQCIDALESEVDFKVKSLRRLGNDVSVVRSTTTNWTLRATGAFGTEAGQLTTNTTYGCVPN